MLKSLTWIQDQLGSLWQEALLIWSSGGWAMVAIAIIALVMFGMGIHVHLRLRGTGFQSVPERTWRLWIDHPAQRRGPIGDLLDLVTGGVSVEETAVFFRQMRTAETVPFERDLKVMKVCVSAAPLVGLLGTVTGMLATFVALSAGGGGDRTMGMVAAGISEALITTETGLVIALPGLFFQYQLGRRFESYKAFLAHLEAVCTQSVFQRLHRDQARAARRAARAKVAETLRARLAEARRDAPSTAGASTAGKAGSPSDLADRAGAPAPSAH